MQPRVDTPGAPTSATGRENAGMTTGLPLEIAGLSKDRDDYLRKQAEAQFAVGESELVEAVRRVLGRQR